MKQPAYVEPDCTCAQEGDFCPTHPACACGCQRHAHRGGPCVAGKMTCHGCDGYRPAQLKKFHELTDDELDGPVTINSLRAAYKILRAHHVEETTALWHKYITK